MIFAQKSKTSSPVSRRGCRCLYRQEIGIQSCLAVDFFKENLYGVSGTSTLDGVLFYCTYALAIYDNVCYFVAFVSRDLDGTGGTVCHLEGFGSVYAAAFAAFNLYVEQLREDHTQLLFFFRFFFRKCSDCYSTLYRSSKSFCTFFSYTSDRKSKGNCTSFSCFCRFKSIYLNLNLTDKFSVIITQNYLQIFFDLCCHKALCFILREFFYFKCKYLIYCIVTSKCCDDIFKSHRTTTTFTLAVTVLKVMTQCLDYQFCCSDSLLTFCIKIKLTTSFISAYVVILYTSLNTSRRFSWYQFKVAYMRNNYCYSFTFTRINSNFSGGICCNYILNSYYLFTCSCSCTYSTLESKNFYLTSFCIRILNAICAQFKYFFVKLNATKTNAIVCFTRFADEFKTFRNIKSKRNSGDTIYLITIIQINSVCNYITCFYRTRCIRFNHKS